jgi:NDP-sugar pyrophosphorylase family protein
MVEVLGRPFLEHQIELLKAQELSNLILCVGYRGEVIRHHFGDGRAFGVSIAYSYDGPEPLGTGGALRNASSLLHSWFLVVNGDSYLPFDFWGAIHRFQQKGLKGIMTVFRNSGRYGPRNVAIRRGYVARYSRTAGRDLSHIDYGLVVFSKAVLDVIPIGFCPMDHVYMKLVAMRQLGAYQVYRRFYEIGDRPGLEHFTRFLSRKLRPIQVESRST